MLANQNARQPSANGRQSPSKPPLDWPRPAAEPQPAPEAEAPDAGSLDLAALAEEVYRLLLREAAVERERLGRPWPAP
jgi:hypothetical protein